MIESFLDLLPTVAIVGSPLVAGPDEVALPAVERVELTADILSDFWLRSLRFSDLISFSSLGLGDLFLGDLILIGFSLGVWL